MAAEEPARSTPDTDSWDAAVMESVPCALCGGDGARERFRRRDLAVGTPGLFRVVRCPDCGLEYLDPRPRAEEIIRCYPPSYAINREAESPWGWWRRWYQNKRVRAVLARAGGGRILDVGCADALFLELLHRRGGWETTGLELNPRLVEAARRRQGPTILQGDLLAAELPRNSFEVITLWDVLEHLHRPMAALDRVHELLAPGGLLVISTPLADSWEGRLFGRWWVGYELPRHLYFFSRPVLARALAERGFRIVGERVLYGTDYAFADQFRFLLRDLGAPRLLYGGASLLLRSLPWRLLAGPLFKLLDAARLSTARTLFCRRGKEEEP